MKTEILLALNLTLVGIFLLVLRKPNLLSHYFQGKWWLTWFSVAIITLMDELTSVFYAPAEAYRFIGPSAILFIALTSLFIHYMTTRLVEIAEILEHHGLIGGGVYSFSYLVLGPMVSFVAVASIMVTYTLTACISSVSAVLNASSFFPLSHSATVVLILSIIWGVAGLNILGARENARFTFAIFVVAAFILINLIVSGLLAMDSASVGRLAEAMRHTQNRLHTGSWIGNYHMIIASMASCILAYSGVESVLQTAGFVRSWREVGKAYIFLAVTVGLVTPLLAALALSAPIDLVKHEGDLITYYATMVNGVPFGLAVGALASFTLTMAVNTAFVASGELMERVAHRYGFHWIIATNQRQSLYRIHILNALFFSAIIFMTRGSQMILADMYALGLIACFCINMGCLLLYRYFMGTKEVIHFHTSRLVTLLIWLIFVSCFIFLAIKKPHGLMLWASVTGLVLLGGFFVAKKRSPEIKEREKADSEMEMILYLAQSSETNLDLIFRRPPEYLRESGKDNEVYISFYSPRRTAPPKKAPNHFRFLLQGLSLHQHIINLLRVVEYELPDRQITVHLGWPMSSWWDRLATGVMVFNMIRLPKLFPRFRFVIQYFPPKRPEEDFSVKASEPQDSEIIDKSV